jgi:hypothetical protein
MRFVHGFVHGGPCSRRLAGAALVLDAGCQRPADDQLRERVRDLAVRLQVGLDVLLHGERHVGVADALAQCLPVDLRIELVGSGLPTLPNT